MRNVLKFTKALALAPVTPADQQMGVKARSGWAAMWLVIGWVWLVLRVPIFLLLYWLRLPIQFVCNLVALPMLLLCLFSLYAFPDKQEMVWGSGVISFLAFTLAWIYDWLLMAIAPQGMVRML